jgi:hypothetical protein
MRYHHETNHIPLGRVILYSGHQVINILGMCQSAKYAAALVAVLPVVSAFTSPENIGRQQTALNVIGQQAESVGPAIAIRRLRTNLPPIEW